MLHLEQSYSNHQRNNHWLHDYLPFFRGLSVRSFWWN